MELNQWIDQVGGVRSAANLLGVKWRTVYSWRFWQRAPSMNIAFQIVTKTNGLVDFNGIYKPYMRRELRL